MRLLKFSLVLAFTTMMALRPASAWNCSNASLNGVYGVSNAGLDRNGELSTGVGQATADGEGSWSEAFSTHSDDGVITTYTLSGTYSISKNCTGTVSWLNPDGSTETDTIVLDDSGKGAQLIRIDTGFVKSGFLIAQGAVTCGLTGKKQTFAAHLTGYIIGTGLVAFVGQVILDGEGNLSGTESFSLGGTIGDLVSITGTYTANADCTGTAQITPQGYPTMNFASVVVNGGNELLLIETDSNTIVSGTASTLDSPFER
jgi:hypothetical protein